MSDEAAGQAVRDSRRLEIAAKHLADATEHLAEQLQDGSGSGGVSGQLHSAPGGRQVTTLPRPSAAAEVAQKPLSHLERARVLMALWQAVHAAYVAHGRTHGLDVASTSGIGIGGMQPGEAMRKEAARLAAYFKKVNKAVAAEELRHSRPSLSLNVAAANRFIDHAIPDLTTNQRQALLAATAEVQAAAATKSLQQQKRSSTGDGTKRARGGSDESSQVDAGPGACSDRAGGGSVKKARSPTVSKAAMPSAKDAAIAFLTTLAEGRKG
jgi:hypothetical protein